MARALCFQARLPLKIWVECIVTATYLINKTPTTLLNNKSPFELIYNKPPTFEHLRAFGCLCFGHNVHIKHKFDHRAFLGIFVGYSFCQKGYKIFDIHTQQIYVSRDVIFHEYIFPCMSKKDQVHSLLLPLPIDDIIDMNTTASSPLSLNLSPTRPNVPLPPLTPTTPNVTLSPPTTEPPPVANPSPVQPLPNTTANDLMPILPSERPRRNIQPHPKYKDHYCSHAQILSNSSPPGMPYSLEKFLSYDQFASSHYSFLSTLSSDIEPTTFNQAIKFPEWRHAINVELRSLEDTKTVGIFGRDKERNEG